MANADRASINLPAVFSRSRSRIPIAGLDCRGNVRYSADSNACVTTTVAGSSGCVGREFHDEVGVEGCADPLQQRNRGDDAARF